jgi:hypothetical protein
VRILHLSAHSVLVGSSVWEFGMWDVDSIRGVNGWGVGSEVARLDWKLDGRATG